MERKFKVIIFLTIVIFAILYSCGSDNENANTNDNINNHANSGENIYDPGSAAEPEIPDNLPVKDFGGYNFRIYLEDVSQAALTYDCLYIEELNGDILNDAIYNRNKAVEDRFNITISPVIYTEWGIPGERPILAGEDAFDIISSHGIIAYRYAGRNLVVDWAANMPYVDLTKPWWNQDVVDEFSFFGKLNAATGDISYSTLAYTVCVFFNKKLFQELNLEYPYEDVINGAWTLDKFMSVVRNGAADLNGDGVLSAEADRFGFNIYNRWSFPITVLYSGGDRIIKKDGDGLPVLTLYNERTKNIYDKLFDMLDTGTAIVGGIGKWGNPDNIDTFRSGRALFGDRIMDGFVIYREMEDEIGIVPIPKYNESTPKYYSLMEAGVRMITVPVTVNDFERTSVIVEALAAGGYKTVTDVYYEMALKTKYARDDESAAMLDFIRNGMVADFGYLNDALTLDLNLVGTKLVEASAPNFTSFYERYEQRVLTNIERFIEESR